MSRRHTQGTQLTAGQWAHGKLSARHFRQPSPESSQNLWYLVLLDPVNYLSLGGGLLFTAKTGV